MLIRAEQDRDLDAISSVNTAAFPSDAEAVLVKALRKEANPIISLVAELDDSVVGHIMFSPVSLSNHADIDIMGLAPMAVNPAQQGSGIGSALVRAGLEQCIALGYSAAVVLGHPTYYPRFGFCPSSRFNIDSEYEVAEELFMAIELSAESLSGKTGRVKYHPAFSKL